VIGNDHAEFGASASAIQFHYDVSNDFYAQWLDPLLVYTSAKWQDHTYTLQQAQINKLNSILQSVYCKPHTAILDIGCGWGGLLQHAIAYYGVDAAVGLTLSKQQISWIKKHYSKIQASLENWNNYQPDILFDIITSIESIEAFVKPTISSQEKQAVYRHLFLSCYQWLKPSGYFYLQCIGYGSKDAIDLDPFIKEQIFPESDLPYLEELISASRHLFEVVNLVNDRQDYVKTLQCWLDNMMTNKKQLLKIVDENTYLRYKRYLKLSQYMFAEGNCHLYRIIFRKINDSKILK
jgi:cyclopropane-fatty-acyl-phospholipid synthase